MEFSKNENVLWLEFKRILEYGWRLEVFYWRVGWLRVHGHLLVARVDNSHCFGNQSLHIVQWGGCAKMYWNYVCKQ